ncbi:MAG TPA: protealysin inhibitor emfourin [Anaerolineales bacterium]|nr:protealysin inhibitor emfourin [Anaerolineales bacterium]
MHIEKIKFERTGGFAGIRIAAEIEMDDLPDDQKNEILELLDQADFEELAEKSAEYMPMSMPDGFVYDITVIACEEEEVDDEEEYRLVTGESSLPDDLLPLIEILERIAKKQMRNRK